MTEKAIEYDHLVMLRYLLGTELVAALSGAHSQNEVLDWLRGYKTPTRQQTARLTCAYEQLIRVSDGEGTIISLTWFKLADIGPLIRSDMYKEVEQLAGQLMMSIAD